MFTVLVFSSNRNNFTYSCTKKKWHPTLSKNSDRYPNTDPGRPGPPRRSTRSSPTTQLVGRPGPCITNRSRQFVARFPPGIFQSPTTFSSWWLNQPIWKICSSNWIISPSRGENKKIFETTTQFSKLKLMRWLDDGGATMSHGGCRHIPTCCNQSYLEAFWKMLVAFFCPAERHKNKHLRMYSNNYRVTLRTWEKKNKYIYMIYYNNYNIYIHIYSYIMHIQYITVSYIHECIAWWSTQWFKIGSFIDPSSHRELPASRSVSKSSSRPYFIS